MPLLKCSAEKAKPQSAIGYITNPNKAEIVSVDNVKDDIQAFVNSSFG